ncbi:MAG: general secretion pathway protein GspB [Candidatus Thiodiazotropha sp.]
MSLILEALKKAERQHKLGEVPSLGAQAAGAPPSRLRGLGWLMLILLACVMLGLGLYLGGFRLSVPEPPQAAVPAPDSVPEPAQPPPVTVSASPQTESPQAIAPVPLGENPAPPQVTYAPPPTKPARPLTEMPSGFVANLPSLNIDIHSYDQRPAKRYVLINMDKYHEGDYLAEGPQLIEILPDGVILEHLGERFILPIGNQ